MEWRLVEGKIRGIYHTRWELLKRILKNMTCQRATIEKKPKIVPERKSVAGTHQTRLQRWNRRVWTTLWSWLGPRQIFPALDDLQLLCAYVDVHEEI